VGTRSLSSGARSRDPVALPTLVIAKQIIVGLFREEWPAAACIPQQAADDRIESALSRFWLPRSVIASAPSSDPDGCRNNLVRFTRQGRRR
jgi:hypothetical protein